MKRVMWAGLASIAMAWTAMTGAALAAACGNTAQGFPGFIAEQKKLAAAAGVSPRAIAVLDGLKYDNDIIKRDRAQNVFSQSFLDFQAKMISSYRLKQGKALIQKYKPIFDRVQKQYGVPPEVITAFWALETDFGASTGNFDTIQALATLGWDCRRPEKFRPQLIASLQLLDHGDLRRDEFKGAWAGEIGQTQFMAYDYNESAVDFDGDGKRDLRNSVPDVLASTASLLRHHGWNPGQPWLQEVKVPAQLPWDQADIAIQHPRSQWAEWGVTLRDGTPVRADNVAASLLLPMGRNGPAFLAYHNFTTSYLKWNESLVYSTTAAYLATRLGGAPAVSPGRGSVEPLSYEEVVVLQNRLSALGYDVGKADGKIGAGTRAAVKDQQLKLGLPADSYPDAKLIGMLGRAKPVGPPVKPGSTKKPAPLTVSSEDGTADAPQPDLPAQAPDAAPAVTSKTKNLKKPLKPKPPQAEIIGGEGDSLY
ncbi:MAG: lytic murein transglycosylase [Hyphomicrobiales bacterium]